MMRTLSVLVSLLFLGSAVAVPAAEPNETQASATILSSGIVLVTDSLSPGGIVQPDTLLGARNAAGAVYIVDDNGSPLGNGLASSVGGVSTNSGTIRFAVTGSGDAGFTGAHSRAGAYQVFVDVFQAAQQVASFSETRTLAAGLVHEFTLADAAWIGATYDAYIDNLIPSGGDVDFFTFTGLTPGAAFGAQTFSTGAAELDTALGWLGAGGTLLGFNDDRSPDALTSRITGLVPAGGSLTLAVSGVGDDLFQGYHSRQGPYQLRVSVAGALPADFNDDNVVDGGDLATWQPAFGLNAGGSADGDADTDGADFLRWQRDLGADATAGGAAAVPEPASLTLFAIAATMANALRSRRRQPSRLSHREGVQRL